MLAKKGNSMNPSQNTPDPEFIRALARIIAQQGMRQPTQMTPGLMEGMSQGAAEEGFAQDAGLANQMYAPAMSDTSSFGEPMGPEAVPAEPAIEEAPRPKKKKGENSDFFKLLKAVKSGDKNTKKSLKDLAKQLEAQGGEVPVT